MEELTEELYGEGGVNPAAAQKGHGIHQSVQQHFCNRSQVRRGAREPGASGKKTGRVSDVTAASWKRAMLLRMDQESRQMNHQLLLQTLQQTTTRSQKHVAFRSKLLRAAPLRLKGPNQGLPVGAVHQATQVQLTLPRQNTQISVALEEVEQLGGVGHPKGQSTSGGLLALQRKHKYRGRINRLKLNTL